MRIVFKYTADSAPWLANSASRRHTAAPAAHTEPAKSARNLSPAHAYPAAATNANSLPILLLRQFGQAIPTASQKCATPSRAPLLYKPLFCNLLIIRDIAHTCAPRTLRSTASPRIACPAQPKPIPEFRPIRQSTNRGLSLGQSAVLRPFPMPPVLHKPKIRRTLVTKP